MLKTEREMRFVFAISFIRIRPFIEAHQVPSLQNLRLRVKVHGVDGLGGIQLPEPSRPETSDRAVEFLLDAVEPDVWVVAIGPLTNIANVLTRDKKWFDRIAGLSLMGGGAHGGNVTAAAEFNVYFDPEAA